MLDLKFSSWLKAIPLLVGLIWIPQAGFPAPADPSHAVLRAIVLHGKRNLRSLDGLPARGGVVRPGAVYRSARLTHMSAADAAAVDALHLSTLVDVRIWLERVWGGGDSHAVTQHVPHRFILPMTVDTFPGKNFYVDLLKDRAPIRRFFTLLARPATFPILYHCGLGKDRAGTLTALLLDLLGTPRDVIMDDYLASGPDAKREWLQSVFDRVDRGGGIEPFLRGYGVTGAQMAAIRGYLIVPSSASRPQQSGI